VDRRPRIVVTDGDEDVIDRDRYTGTRSGTAAEWLPLHPFEGEGPVVLEHFAERARTRQDTPGDAPGHVRVDTYRHAAPASVPPTVPLTRARDK
jgi:hypothetical protein